MKKIFYLPIVVSLFLVAACSKKPNNNNNNNNPSGPSKVGTTLQLIQDSIYLYTKEDYLWSNQLPSYQQFGPRTFTNPEDLTALQNEMDALSQYAINPATNKPYEYSTYNPGTAKYSFVDDGTETSALNGLKGDFGFDVQYNQINDLRVEYVYPGSPGGLAGMRRGDEITSINNSTSISYDAPGYGSGTSTNLNFVSNAIYNSGTIVMGITRTDGTTYTANISTANYNVNPVLKDTIITETSGKKLGYIVFNSFVSTDVADPLLDAAFTQFANQGITDLVVDLRYNGGGYVSTAEYLDDKIAPAAKSGSLMYTSYYNSNLQNDIYPLLATQFNINKGDFKPQNNQIMFKKSGSLNVSRVFFIMTGQTASASELTINNLRPEMDVQFVGETSYGKPVGFFGIGINKYILFTPEFYVQNSASQGDYYAGFTPGASGYPGVNDYDDLTKDWGDPTEGLLADILSYANTGTYSIHKQTTQGVNGSFANSFSAANPRKAFLNKHQFIGMIGKKTPMQNVLKRK